MEAGNVTLATLPQTPSGPPQSSGNNGGSSLVEHRLSELERRMNNLEGTVKSINDTVIEINTKLDDVASKTYVLTIFAVTGGLALLSILGHLLVRVLSSGT